MQKQRLVLSPVFLVFFLCMPVSGICFPAMAEGWRVTVRRPVLPVVACKEYNPVIRLDIKCTGVRKEHVLSEISLEAETLHGTGDIVSVALYAADSEGRLDPDRLLSSVPFSGDRVCFRRPVEIPGDSLSLWISLRLAARVDLSNFFRLDRIRVKSGRHQVTVDDSGAARWLRPGVAVRQHLQDGVHTSRIPGLATANDGTLLAVYDARYDSPRDLQGNIDIALQRSSDGGATWTPMQVVIDRGRWGGLPEKYNGVSDACILVDRTTGDIWVAALWMYGVLDPVTGRWTEGLTEDSAAWSHQWKGKGSQPGTEVKQSSQFLLARSSDNGVSWSEPVNITAQVKRPAWWLLAPAPGRGITLSDGTLVFPSQGRDENGIPFSTITWSADHGRSWTTGNPAFGNVTECAVAQLTDGRLMLNMRDNRNKESGAANGRRICLTSDRGETWQEHPSSRNALIEPVCMASLYEHEGRIGGKKVRILLFSNPADRSRREKMTLKASLDDGLTWPGKYAVVLDEYRSRGYSCLTSVDEETIGILCESSQADLVFQQIRLNELIGK